MQLLRIPHYNYDNSNVSQVFESSLALLSHFDRVIFTSRHDHQYRCPTLIVWVRWGWMGGGDGGFTSRHQYFVSLSLDVVFHECANHACSLSSASVANHACSLSATSVVSQTCSLSNTSVLETTVFPFC